MAGYRANFDKELLRTLSQLCYWTAVSEMLARFTEMIRILLNNRLDILLSAAVVNVSALLHIECKMWVKCR
jgi:hypothetical protein